AEGNRPLPRAGRRTFLGPGRRTAGRTDSPGRANGAAGEGHRSAAPGGSRYLGWSRAVLAHTGLARRTPLAAHDRPRAAAVSRLAESPPALVPVGRLSVDVGA